MKKFFSFFAFLGLLVVLSACQTANSGAGAFASDPHAHMPDTFWCNSVADKKGQYWGDRRRNEGAVRPLEFVEGNRYGGYYKSDGNLSMLSFRNEQSQCVAVRAHSAKYRETTRVMAGLKPMQDIKELANPHKLYCNVASKMRVINDYDAGLVTRQSFGDGDYLYQYKPGTDWHESWYIISQQGDKFCYEAAGQADALEDFKAAHMSAQRLNRR